MTLMMRIEKLSPPARPGRPWTVILETGDVWKVAESVVAEFALYAGRELTEQETETLKAAAAAAGLKEKAVSLLSGRLMSAGQLEEKLRARGADPVQAEEISAWAQRIGLLNEEEYAKAVVRQGQAKGWGFYRIKQELYRRQVPRVYWEESLAELEAPDEAVDRFLRSRLSDPTDRKQVKKASDALARRGFSWQDIAAGIERARRGEWEEA